MIEGLPIRLGAEKYSFRGEFLDCFARIEHHLAPIINRLVDLGQVKKAPLLFGLKFELVCKTLHSDGIWQNRDHVAPILEELRPFAEMRGLICHGLINDSYIANRPAFSLSLPGVLGCDERTLLSVVECEDIIRNLRKLTDRFLKQRIKTHAAPQARATPDPPAHPCRASVMLPASGT